MGIVGEEVRYSKVFQYLLRLKRIQLELEKSWAEAMQQDRADSAQQRGDSRQQRMPMWRVRQHMTYLITNLQFYIQVDVIESQWKLLQERLEASKDFTELARFHQEYLAALITQSFLDIGSVSRILDSIINLCLQLCHIIEQEDGGLNLTELDRITEVCKIVHDCWSEICAVCSSYNS
jgi:gamma-tubulin complex component 4